MKQLLVAVLACSLAFTASSALAAERTGQQIFDAHCTTCHKTGVAGAPKVGDKAAWKDRIAQGMGTLLEHAEKGIGAMPPKGLCTDCTKEELKGAIKYMVDQSK